jgi:hypothetical protein
MNYRWPISISRLVRDLACPLAICISIFRAVCIPAAASDGEAIIQLRSNVGVDHCGNVPAKDCNLVPDFDAAQKLINEYAATGKLRAGGPLHTLRVVVPSGVYRLANAIEINAWGKVGVGPSLILQGAGRELSRISGALQISKSDWRYASPNELRLTAEARRHVRVIDYEKLTGRHVAFTFTGEQFGTALRAVPLLMTMNGNPMVVSRWPNEGYATIESAETKDGITTVRFSEKGLHGLPESGAILSGYLFYDWAYERLPVTRNRGDDSAVEFARQDSVYGAHRGQRVVVENSLAELDSPGEWYFDQATQQLYFWPLSEPLESANDELETAIASQLIHVQNSNNVRIEHLGLDGSLNEGLSVNDSADVVVDDVDIRNVANRAVTILGGSNVTLSNCRIAETGAGGVYVYGGDRNLLRPGLHNIRNCEIRRFGQRIRTYQPAIRLEGVGNSAVGNMIYDAPHSAIIFSGNDHLIEGNNIADVVKEANDAGAIYTGRDWTARGTIVRDNFIRNVRGYRGDASQAVGVYLDDQASGISVEDNIFVNVSIGVLMGGGRDDVLQRNIFVHNRIGIATDARGITWQRALTEDTNGALWQNMRRVPFSAEQYRLKYPHLADLPSDNPGVPKYNVIRWNAFVDSKGIENRDAGFMSSAMVENVSLGMDALAGGTGSLSLQSPESFEIRKDELPQSWPPISYPLRKEIPR